MVKLDKLNKKLQIKENTNEAMKLKVQIIEAAQVKAKYIINEAMNDIENYKLNYIRNNQN